MRDLQSKPSTYESLGLVPLPTLALREQQSPGSSVMRTEPGGTVKEAGADLEAGITELCDLGSVTQPSLNCRTVRGLYETVAIGHHARREQGSVTASCGTTARWQRLPHPRHLILGPS